MAPTLSLAPRLAADVDQRTEHSHAPLATIAVCLTVLLLVSGAFWAGRIYEQRTQLGYLLAAAPALDDLAAAIRGADSVSMEMAIQLGRLRRKR